MTYEKLGAVERKDGHRSWTGSTLREQEPSLDTKRFPHALAYREYLTDDARLVIANARSAAAHGARVINHAPVIGLRKSGERVVGASARCELSGERVEIDAKVIVNATGPWVEAIQKLEDDGSKPLLHLSKGIHISIPATTLPVRNLMVLNTADKRRIFAIRRGDVVYVGTTDTTYEPGAEIWPSIDADDVDYLLAPLAEHFTCGEIGRGDVVGAWAGLRPLIADPSKKNPAELSRRDELLTGPGGVLSVAGGKLTGYRGMARRVLTTVAERLGRDLPEPTDEPPLPGGDFDGELEPLASSLAARFELDERTSARVARLFGAEAEQVLALGAAPLFPGSSCVEGEVRWAVEQEGAATLEDVLYRRTRLPLYGLDPAAAIEPLAARLAAALGWGDDRRQRELDHVRARLAADLAFHA